MHSEFEFFPLFLVMVIALLSPMFTAQLRAIKIPSVAVEIIAGMILGKHVLNLLPSSPNLDFLGLMGFIFLMFLSGLEVDVHKIIASLPRRKLTWARAMDNPLLVGIMVYIGTLIIALLGAWMISSVVTIRNIWFFAVIISTTSLGVIIPILKERGEIHKTFGQMLILAAAVADVLGILLFTFTTAILKNGFEVEILLILLLFIAFYLAYRVGNNLVRNRFLKRIMFQLSHSASQLKVRGTLLLLTVFLIIAQFIHVETILGAFLAGVLMSFFLAKERSSLVMKLDAMGYGFFIPIFFILVGASIDLSVIGDFENSYLFLGALVLLFFGMKVLPSLIWVPPFGLKKALAGGFLLSSQLSLIIAAAQIGMQLGVISAATNAAFVIMAVITCIVSPIMYNLLSEKKAVPEDKVIIVGGSTASELLAQSLHLHGKQVIIIETDQHRVEHLRDEGLKVIHGNGADTFLFGYLRLQPENHVIILTESDEKNLTIAQILRNDLHHEKIISYAKNAKYVDLFKDMEVEALMLSQTLATSIENLIFRPATYHTLFESFENFSVEEIPILNNALDGVLVKDIPFHQDGFLMLIKRKNDMRVPHGNDYLIKGDIAVVFGNDTALNDFRSKFADPSLKNNKKKSPSIHTST